MTRGGKRDGSGRPTRAEAAKRAKLLALAIEQGPEITPRQFLTGIMTDPSASKVMRMQAAVALAKLPPDPSPRRGRGRGSGRNNSGPPPDVIYSIPHGVQFSADRQTLIWPETGAIA